MLAIKMPWRFTNCAWEQSFTIWHSNIVFGKRAWILFASFPFQLAIFSIPQLGVVERLRLMVSCFGMVFMLHDFWSAAGSKPAPRNGGLTFAILVRLFLLGASHSFVTSGIHEVVHVENVLRWIIISSLGVGTFEEQIAWSGCVLGGRCFYLYSSDAHSKYDPISFIAICLHLFMMYLVLSSRRKEWCRVLATASFVLSGDPAGEQHARPEDPNWHDDYFTVEEWQKLAPVIEKEKKTMTVHGMNTVPAKTYDWIHTYKRLGEGAYGVVRVVKSRSNDSIRAMKISRVRKMKPKEHGSRTLLDSFVGNKESMTSEAMLLNILRHPNVVEFVEEVVLNHETHLVMELCDGGTLAQLIGTYGALDLEAVQWFTKNIAAGLHFLHRHGVSHRDLKPSNCLLTRSKQGVVLKLADFGFGSQNSCSREKSRVVGTPEYIAPEMGVRGASQRRMDIWALGVCVLEMMTCRTLLDLTGEHALLNNQVGGMGEVETGGLLGLGVMVVVMMKEGGWV